MLHHPAFAERRTFRYPLRSRLVTWIMIALYLASLIGISLVMAILGDGTRRVALTSTVISVPFGAIACYLYHALIEVHSSIQLTAADIVHRYPRRASAAIPWTAIAAIEYREDRNQLVIHPTAPYAPIVVSASLEGFETLMTIIDQRLTRVGQRQLGTAG
jgi:hypothetical protein